jgi:hypothetical protein
MSAGSGASNLGYGNIAPLSNINGKYVNGDSSNNPATFGSNQIPGLPGLAGAKNNVDAAKGYVPGICLYKGGSKGFKRKIKKISRKYKMKGGKHTKRIKRRVKSRFLKRRVGTRKNRSLRKNRRGYNKSYKGGQPAYPPGYGQYQNNEPMTPTYSVGGILNASDLGLANPPPIKLLPNCTNCVDNYNHYTGKGFASRGH